MKSLQTLTEKLESELYLKTTGYTTALEVEASGSLNGLDYNACVYEIVVLDYDGKVIAYRYSDDGIDDSWKLGTIGDVVDATLSTQTERIMDALTDEDIAIWHSGEIPDGDTTFSDLEMRFGVFQVWGSRTGGEPLTITAGE